MAIVGALKDLGRVVGENRFKNQFVTATYEVLKEVKSVLVRVPKESGFMQRCPAFVASNGFKVPPYWKNGKPLNRVFLNTNFYGINHENLGKNIIATVKVIKKVMSDGREFVMLDVINTPGVAPEYDLKFPETCGKGVPIIGTNQEVEFRERPKKS